MIAAVAAGDAFGLRQEAMKRRIDRCARWMNVLGHAQGRDIPSEAVGLPGLLARAAAGDAVAWRELIGLYARRVFAMAFSRLRSREAAEEISQSVFATLAAKLGSGMYTEQGKFESWLMRVTMNRIRDEARRARRHAIPTDPSMLLDARVTTDADSGEADGQDERSIQRLREAMERLPDADREVLMLRHQGQMGFKEIAELLGEPVGTLLARHHRALKKIRELLEVDPGSAESGPGGRGKTRGKGEER
jgi:RNA polymerase sigma-70 factor (ECF subfamily)